MGQLTIYLDSETAARLDAAAKAVGLSRSRWVAEVIREKTATEWPESVYRALGSWPEAPTAEELRDGMAEDVPRESL
jgi:predicted transcriptional regulator